MGASPDGDLTNNGGRVLSERFPQGCSQGFSGQSGPEVFRVGAGLLPDVRGAASS
jgi:hypothetical protein